MLLVFLERKKT